MIIQPIIFWRTGKNCSNLESFHPSAILTRNCTVRLVFLLVFTDILIKKTNPRRLQKTLRPFPDEKWIGKLPEKWMKIVDQNDKYGLDSLFNGISTSWGI